MLQHLDVPRPQPHAPKSPRASNSPYIDGAAFRKTYLGESITEDDFVFSKSLLSWASERYPDSAVFGFWQTELHVIRTEVRAAVRCVQHVHQVLAHLKLPAIDSFLAPRRLCLRLSV